MKQLITSESPSGLIQAFTRNHIFHAVVNKHEKLGSSYVEMLEEAVILLTQDADSQNKLLMQYAALFGPINSPR